MKFFICIFVFTGLINIYSNDSVNFLNGILKFNGYEIDKSYYRLSGGRILLRDDPANYVIYEKLEDQMRGIDKIINNSEDMVSYYKYMEAVLSGMGESLSRIKELLIQKDNGILNESDREIIDNEIKQYYSQINYDLAQAEFNKVKVFSDLLKDEKFKNYFDNKKYYDYQNVDNIFNYIISQRSIIGAMTNRLESQIRGDSVKKQNTAGFISHGDTKYSSEVSNLKKYSLIFMINILLL